MSKSINIDEAIALILNIGYIPEGLTALEMTAAFLEEAEVEYMNAGSDYQADELSELKTRFEICEARHTLGLLLQKALQREIDHPVWSDLNGTKLSCFSIVSASMYCHLHFMSWSG